MKKKNKHHVIPFKKQSQRLPETSSYYYRFPLFIIVLISFIVFLPVLQNGFVNLDDDRYILNNSLISTLNLGDIFSRYVEGNYHPLTMLIYSIEYQFFGLNPVGYHAFNLLLHLLNVIMVFYVVLLLSNRKEAALVASLLFGIHPLHVESVAWVSELKDLLYTFFFLAAWLCYLRYLKELKRKFFFVLPAPVHSVIAFQSDGCFTAGSIAVN